MHRYPVITRPVFPVLLGALLAAGIFIVILIKLHAS